MQETVLDFAPDHASSWNQFVDIVSCLPSAGYACQGSSPAAFSSRSCGSGWTFLRMPGGFCARRHAALPWGNRCSALAGLCMPAHCTSASCYVVRVLLALQVRFNLMTSDWVS